EALIALAERSVLERAGYRVVIARTGEDAVAVVRSDDSIALVLMDIDLGPGIDGPTAAERILADHDVPLAFLSSHIEPDVVDRTEGITSYGYIVKNTGNTVLLASIRMAFRLHAAHLELVRRKELLDDALIREEHASEQLRDKSDELDRYFDASLDLLCIASTDGRLLRLNPEWERTLGHPVSDLLGQRFMDFVHPDDRDATTSAFARLADQQSVEGFENRYRCADGSYRWIEWRSKPLGSTVYAAARDVTDRRQALESVRRSEAMLRNLMENSADAVQLLDPQGRFLDANRVAHEMLGYTRDELLSMSIADIDPNYPADGFESFWRAQPAGASVVFETVHRHRDGRRIPVEINGIFFLLDGVEYVYGVARDVSERIRSRDALSDSERRFNAFLAHSPLITSEIAPDGRYLWVNKALASSVGMQPDDLIGKRFRDVLPEELADTFAERIARVRDNPAPIQIEDAIDGADGVRHFITTLFPLFTDDGELTSIGAIAHDVTERERAAAAVAHQKQLLETVVATSPDGFWLFDAGGRIVEASAPYCAMSSYTQEELRGMPISEIDVYETPDDTRARISRILSTGREVFVSRHRRKNGSVFDVEVSVAVLPDGDGQLVCFCRDITERVRIESEAKTTAELQRLLMSLAVRLVSSPPDRADNAIRQMLAEVGEFTGVDRTFVFAHDFARGITTNTHEWCADGVTPEMGNLQAVPLDSMRSITDVHRHGDAFVVPSVADLPADDPIREILQVQGIQSLLLLPLLRDGQSVGMIGFDSVRRERVFTDGLIDLLKVLAALLVAVQARRDTDATLRSERQRLQGIIDGTNVGTWEWNVQTGETVFNDRWADIVGYTLDEISPVSIATWERFTHPDDLAESARRLEEHFAGRSDFYEAECRMHHRDGRWVWVVDRGRVVSWTSDGRPILMMGTHQDITARKEAERVLREREERFRSLLDRIRSVPVQGFDRDGVVHYWNAASEALYGYTSEEAVGANVVDLLIPDETQDTVRGRIREMADTVDSIPPTEDWIRRKDGSLVRVMTSHAVVHLPGKAPEVFCLDFDVSERYAAEARVADLARERETLLKEVQHRIKNNMNTMVGLLTLQAAALDSPDAAAALHDAVGRFKSMEVLYDQLYRTDDYQHGSVARYTEQLVGKVAKLFPAGAHLVPTVHADEFTLDARTLSTYGLILNELVTNAMKYAFNDGAAPELSVSVNRDGDRVRLVVRDNGPGFPESVATDPTAGGSADSAATSSFGLTMVRSLAEQLGGTLRIESDHGARATVEFDA
ncbi:MAG: PAS domain S-box protein, partial [Spirochaetaceae bacterium]